MRRRHRSLVVCSLLVASAIATGAQSITPKDLLAGLANADRWLT